MNENGKNEIINDPVNHPSHYTTGFSPVNIECIDITRHLPFDLGNAFKYVWRAGKKGDKTKALEDLNKAEWYIRDHYKIAGGPRVIGGPADAVFLLLPIDMKCARYCALSSILTGYLTAALGYIKEMRNEILSAN